MSFIKEDLNLRDYLWGIKNKEEFVHLRSHMEAYRLAAHATLYLGNEGDYRNLSPKGEDALKKLELVYGKGTDRWYYVHDYGAGLIANSFKTTGETALWVATGISESLPHDPRYIEYVKNISIENPDYEWDVCYMFDPRYAKDERSGIFEGYDRLDARIYTPTKNALRDLNTIADYIISLGYRTRNPLMGTTLLQTIEYRGLRPITVNDRSLWVIDARYATRIRRDHTVLVTTDSYLLVEYI